MGSEPARPVRLAWTAGVRFRYSRLKEAALFAADAMGFQSTLVWKLLKRRIFAGRVSNRSSSNLTMKPRLDRVMVTRDRPFCKTRDAGVLFVCTSRISDAACFEHAIASAAEAASFKRANRKKSQGKVCRQSRRRVEARIEMPRCRTRKTSDYPPQLCVG